MAVPVTARQAVKVTLSTILLLLGMGGAVQPVTLEEVAEVMLEMGEGTAVLVETGLLQPLLLAVVAVVAIQGMAATAVVQEQAQQRELAAAVVVVAGQTLPLAAAAALAS